MMMIAPSPYEANEDNNPLDMIEEVVQARGWKFERGDNDYLTVEMPGQKFTYDICMEWQEEFSSLLFACSIPVEISTQHLESAARTLEQINQNLWLGHFDLSNQGKFPTFRHTFLLRMIPTGLAVDIVNDVFDLAIAECNRFATTFQLVQAGDVRLQDNISAAVFETVGEA